MQFKPPLSFFRAPSNPKSAIEDGHFFNLVTNVGGASDGLSGAFSPDHPPLLYPPGTITGGTMASTVLCMTGMESEDSDEKLEELLECANRRIRRQHERMGQYLGPVDVGGCGLAVFKIAKNGVYLKVASDCFHIWKDGSGMHMLTGFDQAAEDTEARYEAMATEVFGRAKNRAEGWNEYRPILAEKKLKYNNKLMREGGWAMLNGDPAFMQCLSDGFIGWGSKPEFLLTGTDGMLPESMAKIANREELLAKIDGFSNLSFGEMVAEMLKVRDEETKKSGDSPHMAPTEYPEATLIKVEFY